jgi:KilA-N domain/Protein of unknown function (DUF3627)
MITDIRDIAFKSITGSYYYGSYGRFEVIINKENGYINATHLCAMALNKNGSKKEFKAWAKNESARELIKEVASSGRIPPGGLFMVITGGNVVEIRGTYAHPKLIPHIACWASVSFAVMVSDIVNEYLVREYKESIRVKDQTIDRLERTVAEIRVQNDEQSKQIAELLTHARRAEESHNNVLDQLDVITAELEETSVQNDSLAEKVTSAEVTINTIAIKLDIATDQRVPPARQACCGEVLAIYRNPTTGKFYMIRRQKKTLAIAVRNCKSSGYTEQFYCSDSPNAVNLGQRIKDVLPKTLGRFAGTIITLMPGKSPADLLEYITQAEREKKAV